MATAAITSYGATTSGAVRGEGNASVSALYLDPEAIRAPDFTVYVHSISKRGHMQPHTIYRNVAIPPCPKDRRYITVFRVQNPVQQPRLNPDNVNGPPLWKYENAKAVALSICNPGYQGTDLSVQDKEISAENVIASGECNLTRQGIFASMNEVPTEEELRKAEARRDEYYRFRLREADGLARSNPRHLQNILMEDHYLAADHFGIETEWRRNPIAKIDCPNCGEKIPTTAAFHYQGQRICVLDWEKAWLAGAIKKEDVPEPKRWWSDDEPEKRGPGRPRKDQTADV